MYKINLMMEVPTAHLDDVNSLVDGHFVIATELLRNPDYLAWYRNYGQVPRGARSMVMLDNGAYEHKSVDAITLIRLAEEIRADLVWAPDTLYDREQTEAQIAAFYQELPKKVPWLIGLIPQGSDANDIIRCWEGLEKYPHDIVGLSFRNPREQVVTRMDTGKPLHYLGLRSLEEVKTWPRDRIVSMDTVKPFKAAYYTTDMNNCRNKGVWNSRMSLETTQMTTMYRNIAQLHAALTT